MAAQVSTIATGYDPVPSLRRCVTSCSAKPQRIVLSYCKSDSTFSEHRWNYRGTAISELECRSVRSTRICRKTTGLWSIRATLGAGVENRRNRDSTLPQLREFLEVQGVSYRPPGTESNLLTKVSLSLPENSFGLIYGRSGSGKTTLLQVLAGLATPTEGSIALGRDTAQRSLSTKVGIVFQFPERYFLADTVLEELTFGWSRRMEDMVLRQQLAMRLQAAVFAVGMADISFDTNPRALSDGYKRRLALAVQLVRMPDLLLLDEPLAGLDWRARADVVRLLAGLKRERTLIVVSHDLKELTPLVDRAWRMEIGGSLTKQLWPPVSETN